MMDWLTGFRAPLLLIGPGIFCIGYTIGTGSVTSMLEAGSDPRGTDRNVGPTAGVAGPR
jgi:hypothetical protein